MINYIPLDFFTHGKNTVYTNKKSCIEKEGSAIAFDSEKTNIIVSIIKNGHIIKDPVKIKDANDKRIDDIARIDADKAKIKDKNASIEDRLEALIEHLGLNI